MKKLINFIKFLLLTIFLVFTTTNKCFASMVMPPVISPIEPIESTEYSTFAFSLGIIIEILGVIFVMALLCMLFAKLNNIEELLYKTKNICENFLYYILFIIGLELSVFQILSIYPSFDSLLDFALIDSLSVLGILELISMFISLFLRIRNKRKTSYIVLLISLTLLLFVCFPELNIIFRRCFSL